ncbi:MAG TPA: HDIG domain-containing protein [Fimbriimonadales bacterium]|nr:HDIG domain-containing protein [Fimbriimonadales bacterium]
MEHGFLGIAGMQIARYALPFEGGKTPEVAPLASAPMLALGLLASSLIGLRQSILIVTLATLGAIATQILDPKLLIGTWLATMFGAHWINPMRQRSHLLRTTYYLAAAFFVVSYAFAMLNSFSFQTALLSAGWGVIASVFALALYWFGLVAFEKAFNVVSDTTLLELCSPDHPLLLELMTHAPGTYAHSVMVGNLAEHAARAIGAHPLRCRAMAYYHDVGKMKRPSFFIENKVGENPHEKLMPALSARIISTHVKDGLQLAEKYRLPQPIRDAIAEHHGTSLISYFYSRYTKDTGAEDPILEQHFRYPGPKPRSKETAILMLADRVEAATRTLPNFNPGRLRTYIQEIVQDAREDGQLDDSELTFRDLHTIVDSFVATLSAVWHERIDYTTTTWESIEDETSDIHRESVGKTPANPNP